MTVSLIPNLVFRAFTSDGTTPLAGGLLYTYSAGTTTLLATYTDSTGLIQNTNPIILDSVGEASIWLGNSAYKFLLKDSNSVTQNGYPVDNVSRNATYPELNSLVSDLQANLANTSNPLLGDYLLGVNQNVSGSIGRTQHSKNSDIFSVFDFGVVGDGVNNDRNLIQNSLNSGKSIYFPVPSSFFYISDSISPLVNQKIYGDGNKSIIKTKDGTVNCFLGSSVDNVSISDLSISTVSQTNATAYIGAVLVFNSSNWDIKNITVSNWGYWGICLNNASNCKVSSCRLNASWFGAVQDSADIAIFQNSNYNLIDGNYCYGGGNHGIFIQDPYVSATPTGNIIINNIVGQHTGDGISVYVTTAYDTQTTVSTNHVRDILGTNVSGNSGHGIYIQSCGGTNVTNNTVYNCCRSTTVFETQVVGHIGISTGDLSVYPTGNITPVICCNNHINAPRGPGIYSATCSVPVLVMGNNIISTGTTAVRGEAILFIGVNGAQAKDNIISHVNTNYSAISVVSGNGQSLDGSDISHNRINGLGSGLTINRVGSGVHTNVNVVGNRVGGSLSGVAFTFERITNLLFSNNNGESTGIVFTLTNCPNTRMSANRLYSSNSPYVIIFTGTNTGSVCDRTNILDGVIQNNIGNGMLIEQYADALPMAGIFSIGDRLIRRTATIGSWKEYWCTTGGAIGTAVFTSTGNL